jgi:heme A synthase
LLLALSLFALALWTGLGHKYGFPNQKAKWSLPSKLSLFSFILLIIQITYGGFTAGLKAGHVSDTWPMMFGKLIPPNLFNSLINLIESPQTIVFIHRWFGFTILILTPILYSIVKKKNYPSDIQNGVKWLIGVILINCFIVCQYCGRIASSSQCSHFAWTFNIFSSSLSCIR